MNLIIFAKLFASLAQLVEQLIRNEQVVGSSPIGGSRNLISSIVFEASDRKSAKVLTSEFIDIS